MSDHVAPSPWGSPAVPPHEHVILDEDLMHAYQDLSGAVARFVEGNATLGYLRAQHHRFEMIRAQSLDRTERDPRHHL